MSVSPSVRLRLNIAIQFTQNECVKDRHPAPCRVDSENVTNVSIIHTREVAYGLSIITETGDRE